jgi:hypothetical protein
MKALDIMNPKGLISILKVHVVSDETSQNRIGDALSSMWNSTYIQPRNFLKLFSRHICMYN